MPSYPQAPPLDEKEIDSLLRSVLIDIPEPPYKAVLIYAQAELDYEDAVAR